MQRFAIVCALLAVAGFAVACGNDDGATPTPSPDARAVSDEEYLAIICTGLDRFSRALVSVTAAEDIAEVVEDYIASLEEVSPPEDVRPFHQSFINYLSDSLDEPTQLVTRPRPLPAGDVRSRLAEKERTVDECQDLSFFLERDDDP
jgi:hypothetical protein